MRALLIAAFVACLLVPFGLQAQSQEHLKQVYKMGLKYNDPNVAVMALYHSLAEDTNNVELKDSLANLYFNLNEYAQVVAITNELLAQDRSNLKYLEMRAIALRGLNLVKDALAAYEKLYAETDAVFHLYQIATLQFAMERFGECRNSIGRILANEEATEETVSISLGQGRRQEVKLAAAAYNVLGVMQMNQKENESAKEAFKKALEIDSEFMLARNNLDMLNNPPKENGDQ